MLSTSRAVAFAPEVYRGARATARVETVAAAASGASKRQDRGGQRGRGGGEGGGGRGNRRGSGGRGDGASTSGRGARGARGARGGRRGGKPSRPKRCSLDAVAEAEAMTASLSADADARDVGSALADCKDVRSERASDTAWELYRAAVRLGVVDRFNVRQHNFALGAVQMGPQGPARSREVWARLASGPATPNGVTMALLARGLCRTSADVVPTLATLREGTSRGGSVDAYVLNVLLNACLRDVAGGGAARAETREDARTAALAVWTAGKGIHNERTVTSTIKVLAAIGDPDLAMRTFEEAWRDETPMDVDCLAVALGVAASAKKRNSKNVLELYHRASRERGMSMSTYCANVALAACSRDGNFEGALKLWRDMLEGAAPKPDKASLASVILACGRSGRGDLAREAFEQGKAKDVECDVVVVNVLLDACAKGDLPPGDALDVLMDAIENRVPVDACTIASLLTAYCGEPRTRREIPAAAAAEPSTGEGAKETQAQAQSPAVDLVEQAFAIVELGKFLSVDPTPPVIAALLRVCVAAGDLRRAAATFDEYLATRSEASGVSELAERVAGDNASLVVLIEGFAAAGDLAGAAERVAAARELGVTVSESATATLVRACSDAGESELAMRAYDDATKTHGLVPTTALINAVLSGLARSGSWREAIRLVSDDVIGSETVRADDALVAQFVRAFEVGGEEEQAATARQMGLWLTGSDDALIQHLLERDELGERLL
jgi:pentatricopeptide repeat protein